MKKSFLILLIFFLILSLSYFLYTHFIFKNALPVLAYHNIIENPTEEIDVSIKDFEAQMKYLSKMGYKTLSLDEFYDFKKGKPIKGKKVVLTFDDGMENFYTTVIPILEKYNFKATVFNIGFATNHNNHLKAEQIAKIKKDHPNFAIENHSYNLHEETTSKSNDYTLYLEDLKKNASENYTYYAYPFGTENENYQKALKDANYKLAFIFSPSKWATRNQNDFTVTRVPIYKSNSLIKFILKVTFKI